MITNDIMKTSNLFIGRLVIGVGLLRWAIPLMVAVVATVVVAAAIAVVAGFASVRAVDAIGISVLLSWRIGTVGLSRGSIAVARLLLAASALSVLVFLLFLFVKPSEAVLTDNISKLFSFGFCSRGVGVEHIGFHSLLVESDNLESPRRRDSNEIHRHILVGRIGDFALENVGFEVVVGRVLGVEEDVALRHLL